MPDDHAILEDAYARYRELFERDRRRGTPGQSVEGMLGIAAMALDSLAALAAEERITLMASITPEESRFLHSIALSMAAAALNWPSEEALKYGILALVFENLTDDWRRSLAKLGLLSHSAEKGGLNIHGVYAQVQNLASPEFSRLAEGFFSGGEHDIHSLGWKEVVVNGRMTYKPLR